MDLAYLLLQMSKIYNYFCHRKKAAVVHGNASILRDQRGRGRPDSNPYAEILSADLTSYRMEETRPALCERPPLYARPLDEEDRGPVFPDRAPVPPENGPAYSDRWCIGADGGPDFPKPHDNDYEKLDKKHSYIDIIADNAPIVPEEKYAALVKEDKGENKDMTDEFKGEYELPYGNMRQAYEGNVPTSQDEGVQHNNGDAYKLAAVPESGDNTSCDNLNNNDDIAMYENRNLYMSGDELESAPSEILTSSHQGQSSV